MVLIHNEISIHRRHPRRSPLLPPRRLCYHAPLKHQTIVNQDLIFRIIQATPLSKSYFRPCRGFGTLYVPSSRGFTPPAKYWRSFGANKEEAFILRTYIVGEIPSYTGGYILRERITLEEAVLSAGVEVEDPEFVGIRKEFRFAGFNK